MKNLLYLILILIVSCSKNEANDASHFETAQKNGHLVNEGYNRSMNYVYDWLAHTDSITGLIPQNLKKGKDVWNAHNSAADNYPFMVLTSYLLNDTLYKGEMLEILKTEKRLTSRLGALPSPYSFSKQDFLYDEPDVSKIIFGTSEYIKDGLIPLTEYIGTSPWSDRMFDMLDDLSEHITVAKNIEGYFYGNSVETEINGELLQTLSRIYWMTKNAKYLNWAIEIADYYLLEKPELILNNDRFRLRDHGNEIIGGLSELYLTMHFVDKTKKAEYQNKLYEILDRILEVGRNEDGLFYNEVNMNNGDIVDSHVIDNWGYVFNAYYTIYLIDNHTKYHDAVLKPLKVLKDKYSNYNWEGRSSDGFADAIEGGINLYNREPIVELKEWIDNEIKVMWSIQDTVIKNSGVIEGWHGDGNFARTTIMYCLWKTKGSTVTPWREDVKLGAVEKNNALYISVEAEDDWEGTLALGKKRHQDIFNMPLDYPRINQFPEWYTISSEEKYTVSVNGKTTEFNGEKLLKGIKVKLENNKVCKIKVRKK